MAVVVILRFSFVRKKLSINPATSWYGAPLWYTNIHDDSGSILYAYAHVNISQSEASDFTNVTVALTDTALLTATGRKSLRYVLKSSLATSENITG